MKFETQPKISKKETEQIYREKAKVNGITISAYFDETCSDYVLYLFQMTNAEEFKRSGPYEEIFHIANSEEIAKKIFKKAVELAGLEKSPVEIKSEIETQVKSLEE